jgi:hypothetical protein
LRLRQAFVWITQPLDPQRVSRRNAHQAMKTQEQRRLEREEVERFLAVLGVDAVAS